ncbi:MAG TPA: A24 family peptidase [Bryobacteraceae bacterium]|nr:A24 family peptidase [Bryobacteraceae bacterium]
MPVSLKVILICTVLAAGIFDLRYRRIPNWLNLSAIALGLGMNILLFEVHGLVLALLGLGCSLLIYIPLYLVRGMGAGDVKLMAAVGAIVGPMNWLWIFLFTAVLGGVVSLIYVVFRRRLHQTLLNLALIVTELACVRLPAAREARLDIHHGDALRVPHGAVIALGAMSFLVLGSKVLTSLI